MGGPASSIAEEMYMQSHENTAVSTALHPPKVLEQFLMTLTPFLNART